jgi:hypothetical protein
MKRIIAGMCLTACLVAGTNTRAATGIISYQANANPTNVDAYVTQAGNQFWDRATFGAGPVGTGIVDGGTPAWAVNRSAVGAGEELWRVGSGTPVAIDSADIAMGNAEGWKLTTRLRLPTTGRPASSGAQVDYADGAKAWAMLFGTDAEGDPIVALFDNTGSPPSFTLEGAGNTGYHDYLLAYSPLAGTADLYVDSVLRISGFSGFTLGNPFTRVLFGDAATSSTDQDVHYASVFWVAPEPSAATLLVLGAWAMLRRR